MTSMLGDAFGDQILIPISKSSERRAEREREGCINRICLLIRFSHIVLQLRHKVMCSRPSSGSAVIGCNVDASLALQLKSHQIRPC